MKESLNLLEVLKLRQLCGVLMATKLLWPFFHKNGDIVGNDVIHAIQESFTTGFLPRQWNCTALTLIPKILSPTSIKDYRPFACGNGVQSITKVLASRLQPLLLHLSACFCEGKVHHGQHLDGFDEGL